MLSPAYTFEYAMLWVWNAFPNTPSANIYTSFRKVQESFFCEGPFFEKKQSMCCIHHMSTFLYFLASSFCSSSVICSLHHCQRNIAKIQIWSCLSPAQKYLMPSKCLCIYKITYILPGTWEAFKAFHDSSPTYFSHLSSIMYVFVSYTWDTPALTIHTHNSLSDFVHWEPLAWFAFSPPTPLPIHLLCPFRSSKALFSMKPHLKSPLRMNDSFPNLHN